MTSLYGISIRRSVHPEVNMYVNRVLENSFPLLEKVIIIFYYYPLKIIHLIPSVRFPLYQKQKNF